MRERNQDARTNRRSPARRVWTIGALPPVVLILYLVIRHNPGTSDPELHTIMEIIAAGVTFFAGIIALLRYHTGGTVPFLFVGIGFMVTSLLDGFHAVITSQHLSEAWLSSPSELIPWSWYVSRMLLALLLMVDLLFWSDLLRHRRRGHPSVILWISGVLVVTAAGALVLAALLPAYSPGSMLGRPQELVLAALFLIALVGYLTRRRWMSDDLQLWIVISLLLAIFSHAPFMTLSRSLFDRMFDAAHLLKIASYVVVLAGLLQNVHRRFREATEDAARLSRANRELEGFAYSVSHDLRAPLRAIDGFSRILVDEQSQELPDEAARYLERIRANAQTLDRLITGTLTYSRVGSRRLNLQRVDLTRSAAQAWDELDGERAGREIAFELGPLPTVEADPQQMQMLLHNLLDNAMKFTRPRVQARIDVGCTTRDGTNEIYVCDNGIGFNMESSERLFTMFHRLHGDEAYEGTGAGLATAQRIVHRHGGAIRVHSEEEKGATVFFTIGTAREGL